MSRHYRNLITFVIVALCQLAQAQGDYRFYSFTEKDGLSSNVITSVVEDGDGFIWAGGLMGLNRYDGYTFSTFTPGYDSLSLHGYINTSMRADSQGNLWVSTESGVSKYDIRTEKFHFYPLINENGDTLLTYQADEVFPMKDGRVRCFYSHMYELDPVSGVFKQIWRDITMSVPIRNCFWNGDSRWMMVSVTDNLILWLDNDGNEVSRFVIEGINNSTPYTLLDNHDGTLYFGGSFGLYLLDTNNDKYSKVDRLCDMVNDLQVTCVYRAKDGLLWIGTNGQELYVYDDKADTVHQILSDKGHSSHNKLNSLTVQCIYEDSHGLMWFGTWNGLAYIETVPTQAFENLVFPECKHIVLPCVVSSFGESKDGRLLAIGTDGGGVSYWDRKSDNYTDLWNTDTHDHRMVNSSALAIATDSQGNLYEGGYMHPLHKIAADRSHDENLPYDPSDPDALECAFIKALYMQNDTCLWIATNGAALQRYNPKTGKFSRIHSDKNGNTFHNKFAICLAVAPDGTVLVGTYAGLSTYNPHTNEIKNFYYNQLDTTSVSHNWIYSLLVDSKGRIWVGTCMGLNQFDMLSGTFRHYAENAGFANLVISGMLEDSKGYLWIATGKGIAKFDPETGKVLRLYFKNDGILTNSYTTNAAFKDHTGTMYFGSNQGLVYFRPEDIVVKADVPKPTITGLLIDYRQVTPQSPNSPLSSSITLADTLVLNYKQSTFSLQFASLGFVNSASYIYSYMIKGNDDGWKNIGQRREIDFTKMSPGTYELELMAENPDGVASEVRKLTIIILPPWYWCWQSKLLYLLLVVVIVFEVHRWRVKILRYQKKKLEHTVQIRTMELLSANDKLEEKNQELNQQQEEILSQRDQLYDQNIRLEESQKAVEQSLNNLSEISAFGKQIMSTIESDEIEQMVYSNSIVDLSGCGFCIGICYPTYNIIDYTPYIYGGQTHQLPSDQYQSPVDSETALCIRERKDILAGERYEYALSDKQIEQGLRSAFRFILMKGDEVIGVMVIDSPDIQPFSEEDLANLNVLASYLEAVIDKTAAYNLIKSRNIAIQGSINYAQTIQQALLAKEGDFDKNFLISMIYRPKDVVSGDFFWQKEVASENGSIVFAAVVDCTGHGVPGAFMSIIANTVLNEIVDAGVYEPKHILSELSYKISKLLLQETTDNKDGMDMSLCRFDMGADHVARRLVFAGAKNSLFFRRKEASEYEVIKADRSSIAGGVRMGEELMRMEFSQTEREIGSDDVVYMCSDGILDVGNADRRRFGRNRFQDLLNEVYPHPMDEQSELIQRTVDEFAAGCEQRDDISVLGLKMK